jgi:hypothetical protein
VGCSTDADAQGNQAVHTDLDANFIAFRHHYVALLFDFWQFDW